MADDEIARWPSPEMVAEANLTKLIAHCGRANHDDLLRWSTDEAEAFYRALLAHIDYRFTEPFTQAMDASQGIERTRWCIGGETNVTLNCLDKRRGTSTYEKIALEWLGENGERLTRTYRESNDEACRLAARLRRLGIGDVIAMHLPNVPEAVTTLLAVPKIGGTVLPLFSGFGPEAVAARLIDASAKAVITVDGSYRRGKVVAAKAVIDRCERTRPA